MKIHHIGYAVKNIQKAEKAFSNLGFTKEGEEFCDNKRGVSILFMNNENYRLELVSPLKKDAPVSEILKKNGNSPYHICYEVEDIIIKRKELMQQGYIALDDVMPADAIGGAEVCFLYKKDVGLLELVSIKEKNEYRCNNSSAISK